MADSKVSELTAASSAASTDLLYLVQSNASKRIAVGNLAASITTLSSAPSTAKGAAGDKYGSIRLDTNYLYVCTADYTTGTANIWKRVSITAW